MRLRIITESASCALCGAPHKAEFERELIHARTSEGRKRAQADGVKMGRPPKLDAFQQREALKRLKAGESSAAIGRTYGVHRSTIERLVV